MPIDCCPDQFVAKITEIKKKITELKLQFQSLKTRMRHGIKPKTPMVGNFIVEVFKIQNGLQGVNGVLIIKEMNAQHFSNI